MTNTFDTSKPGQQGLQCGSRWLDLSSPVVMGIVNVTPDSFSDGGRLGRDADDVFAIDLDKVLSRVEAIIHEGAAIVDIGGESTRPGAQQISEQEELDRVIPVVEAVADRFDTLISVDTSSVSVITAAVSVGAHLINDIRALSRPGALTAAADSGAAICLMHMQGDPGTMQQSPHYDDVVSEVIAFLQSRIGDCTKHGVAINRLCVDPGFGFGKTLAHNYRLLAELTEFAALGVPLLAGLSRKSMLGAIIDRPVYECEYASVAAAVLAAERGASILRVHDVAPTVDALKILAALPA